MRSKTVPDPQPPVRLGPAAVRRAYVPPRLERRGDVRSSVLGPTAGPGDSPAGGVPI